ncbi:MAG: hypothetical protein JXA45_00870 [Methanomassiliicoccales archaeon]|nr:hypothetical protein [Methanomassiliicoccales archaeon]
MKQIIINILSEEGRSISYLSRELKRQGFDMHRLILTGYLRALTDLNVLKEKDVPPAKIYVPVKGKERDIYGIISDQAKMQVGERGAELALYTLYSLFRRPIFEEELRRAGIFNDSPGVPARAEETAEVRKLLLKTGFKIPTSSKAFVPLNDEFEDEYQALLEQLIINGSEASYLVRETKQTRFEL